MSASSRLDLVLLWHMHQPDFRDPTTGEFTQPWVYLHALKDYTDMAAHLEQNPGVRAVVNLVPILLDQIEDYSEQFASGRIRDPLLKLLCEPELDRIDSDRHALILERCFMSNHSKMIEPFTPYKRLRDLYRYVHGQGVEAPHYLSGQYLADLLTWYHLSWSGETVRRSEQTIVRLMAQGEGFSHAERMALFEVISKQVSGIIPRYRRLAEAGQIEISSTPHFHPIGPLLLDLRGAHEALPEAPLPKADRYCGGRSRLTWHLQSAQSSHEHRFGMRPQGIWPAEGAVSTAFAELLAENGCTWMASGQTVLTNSLKHAGLMTGTAQGVDHLYRPYRVGGSEHAITCFFRDDRLSDLIGFEYKDWHGQDAVQHFVIQMEQILTRWSAPDVPVVSVILDGENAWEHYPYNGFYFLHGLYQTLGSHPSIRTATFSDVLSSSAVVRALPRLVAGSWVYGSLSTWIGSAEKNLAWDLLASAKQNFDLVIPSGRLSAQQAEQAARQLAVCEGSDWFWWFGDYNPRQAVETFDQLFRANLTHLYQLLQLTPPAQLAEPISHGGGHPEDGGAMRRAA